MTIYKLYAISHFKELQNTIKSKRQCQLKQPKAQYTINETTEIFIKR